jgi:hypothetical protein
MTAEIHGTLIQRGPCKHILAAVLTQRQIEITTPAGPPH